MRRPRARVWIGAILVLFVLAGAGLWWLFYTEPGARWGFERFGGLVPGKLEVGEVRGRLGGPIRIRDFTYRDEGFEITAVRVEMDYRVRDLLRREWDIQRLRAEGVRVLLGTSGDTPAERDSLEGPLPDLNLPVDIILRDGVVTDVTITTPGAAGDSLFLDRIALKARSLREDSLHVDRLAVESEILDLEFSGVALPRGSYPVALRGSWTFRPEEMPAVAGRGTVEGTLDTLRVEQTLSEPAQVNVAMRVFRPFRDLGFEGDVRFTEVTPRRIDPEWPEGTYSGTVHVEGDLDDLEAAGTVRGTTEPVGRAVADFRVRRARELWRIDRLLVTRPGGPGSIRAHGTVTAREDAFRFDLETEWTDLAWPLQGDPVLESGRGTARVEGTLEDFDVELRAAVAPRDAPPGTMILDGRGGDGRLAIRTVIVDALDGRITASGRVAWEPAVRWDLEFQGTGINPGVVWEGYRGSLAFAGRSEGALGPRGPSGEMLVSRLDGTLRGQPVSGSGSITARGGQYTLSAAQVQYGPNRAEASGGFGRVWSLDWRLMAPQLAAAIPQASGSLEGQGSVRGTGRRPRITGTVTGDSLFFGRLYARTLQAEADVDLSAGGTIRIEAVASGIGSGTRSAEHAILTASGTRARQEIRASLAGPADSVVAVLAGGLVNEDWRGALQTFDLVRGGTAPDWTLERPAPLVWSDRTLTLSDFVLRSGSALAALDGMWSPGGPWSVDSRIEQVDLSLLDPALPPRLRIEGALHGGGTVRATAEGRLFSDLSLTVGPGRVLHHTATGQWIPTPYENAVLRVDADGRRAVADMRADFVNVGMLRGMLEWPATVPSEALAGQPLDGFLRVNLNDLSMLQGLTFELGSTSGSLDADLRIAGTVGNPTLSGTAIVQDASAYIPRLGIAVRDFDARATGAPGGGLSVNGSFRSGPGRLTFDGMADVGVRGRPQARLTLRGERVQVMNTSDTEFLASPDLRVALDGNRLNITGEVAVPSGEIEVGPEDREGVIRPSEDVVYARGDTLTTRGFEVYMSVRMNLGDDVLIRGFGLEVEPTGSILVIEEPGLPMLGTGQLTIEDGTYIIYGQSLKVESGSLIFGGGPITNPAIRARASRTAPDGVVAGFTVRGTVMHPDVRIFSDPAMSESQALSYILFGKPIEQGYLSEGQMASTLASTLGVPANLLAQGAASEVGIEEAQIHVGDSIESATVRLGTHLSPRLYISYGMDVFESESSILVRYILNRVFTIEAETSNQNRVDVLYTLEP